MVVIRVSRVYLLDIYIYIYIYIYIFIIIYHCESPLHAGLTLYLRHEHVFFCVVLFMLTRCLNLLVAFVERCRC